MNEQNEIRGDEIADACEREEALAGAPENKLSEADIAAWALCMPREDHLHDPYEPTQDQDSWE